MSVSTPIVLFGFNRPEKLKQLLERVVTEPITRVFVYCDGPRGAEDEELCEATRQAAEEFANQFPVTVRTRPENYGITKNLVCAVSEVLSEFRQAMFFEDDVHPRPGCLGFLDRALEAYRFRQEIFSIGCYHRPVSDLELPMTFLSPRFNCWGWATWRDRWQQLQEPVLQNQLPWQEFYEVPTTAGQDLRERFRQHLLKGKTMEWDTLTALWCLKQGWYQVQPKEVAVTNVGFDNTGIHCRTNDSSKECFQSSFLGDDYWEMDGAITPNQELVNAVEATYDDPNITLLRRIRRRVEYQVRRFFADR